MWEKIINCLTKGGAASSRKCQFLHLSELYKRCPPNQRKEFALFKKKNDEYKERLQRFPDSMPKIDWKYYETNVRPEYVPWVKRFQGQYEQFDTFFENRHTLIDPSKYFCEVQEEKKEVQKQVERYKKASNERIKRLENRLKFLKNLKPYEEMTMEEFCHARPEMAPDFINKPTFWPHTPEEQKPGPQEEVHEISEEEKPQVKMEKPKDGEEPPKTPPASAAPTKTTPTTAAPPQKPGATKAEQESKVCSGKEPQPENPIDVEKLKETASELAVKGGEIATDLAKKVSILLKQLIEKFNEKRKEVEAAAKKAREENKAKTVEKQKSAEAASKGQVDPDEVDSIYFREGSKNICHQTIIKGEEEASAEVKPKHANLNEEVEGEREVVEETEKKYKKKSPALNMNELEAMEVKADEKKNGTSSQKLTKEASCKASRNVAVTEKAIEKQEKTEDSETQEICQQVCEELSKVKSSDKSLEAIECLEEIVNDLKRTEEGSCDSEKEEEESSEKQESKGKQEDKTKASEKETTQCFQTFLEENAKKCEDAKSKVKKSWEGKDSEKCSIRLESLEPKSSFESAVESIDVVGRPKTSKSQEDKSHSKTNEKALLSDFKVESLERNIFMGFKSSASDETDKTKKDIPTDAEDCPIKASKEGKTTENPTEPVYAGTRQTHELLNDLEETKKVERLKKAKEELQLMSRQKKNKEEIEQNAEEETEQESSETEKTSTNEKKADSETTFYPKLMINAKPKEKGESSKTPPAPKAAPSVPEAFIPRTSTPPPTTAATPPTKANKPAEVLESAQEMAKKVFAMATDAAALLTDATNAVEKAKKAKTTTRVENLEAAYLAAQKQANRALSEAYKAMGAAKKLTKRSRRSQEEQNRDPDALVMAEKHAVLAKLLARRTIALKKEIEKILEDLKGKQ